EESRVLFFVVVSTCLPSRSRIGFDFNGAHACRSSKAPEFRLSGKRLICRAEGHLAAIKESTKRRLRDQKAFTDPNRRDLTGPCGFVAGVPAKPKKSACLQNVIGQPLCLNVHGVTS